MVATSLQIMHEQNFEAEYQLHIIIGSDGIVRVNIDGVCALRVRLKSGCKIELESPVEPVKKL